MRIYVASSWRNPDQPAVVEALRAAGHDVYDFRAPVPGNDGFRWTDVDPEWQSWSPERFREQLAHPVAEQGFGYDMTALARCDACVMVLPCGRSASLEMGYAIGAGKTTVILLADGEPELMFKMADHLCTSVDEVVKLLSCPHCRGLGGWVDSDPPEWFICDCDASLMRSGSTARNYTG